MAGEPPESSATFGSRGSWPEAWEFQTLVRSAGRTGEPHGWRLDVPAAGRNPAPPGALPADGSNKLLARTPFREQLEPG